MAAPADVGLSAPLDCVVAVRTSDEDAPPPTRRRPPRRRGRGLPACMSANPVGVGNRLGRSDDEVVMRTRDADGRIRQLDAPLALADDRRCQRALTLAPDAALAAGEWQLSACAPATIRRTPGI